jgi:hypothetical protein
MKTEFAQIMVEQIKLAFGPVLGSNAVDTVFYGKVTSKGKRSFPCILVKQTTSTDTLQNVVNPMNDVIYEVHVFGKYMGTSVDESLATKAMQDAGQLCDSISESLRNNSALRSLCLDFRSRGTRFVPPSKNKEENDYAEASMMDELHAIFNTNAGVIGYSRIGEFILG